MFGAPKLSVSDQDYMIGLYCSSFVNNGGKLQIGSIGDSVAYSLLVRHEHNPVYAELLKEVKTFEKFGDNLLKFSEHNVCRLYVGLIKNQNFRKESL